MTPEQSSVLCRGAAPSRWRGHWHSKLLDKMLYRLRIGSAWILQSLKIGSAGIFQSLEIGSARILQSLKIGSAGILQSLEIGSAGILQSLEIGSAGILQSLKIWISRIFVTKQAHLWNSTVDFKCCLSVELAVRVDGNIGGFYTLTHYLKYTMQE